MGIKNEGREALLRGNGLANEVDNVQLYDSFEDTYLGDPISVNSDDWVWVNNELRLDKSFQVEFTDSTLVTGLALKKGNEELWSLDLDPTIDIPSEGGIITFNPEQQTIYVKVD